MLSRDLSKFKTQIKLSNHPPYSQLSSICKCQMMRIEYEEKNNIFYDVVVRTRTDVQFTFPKIDKLTKSIRFLTGTRPSVFFPGLWVRGFNNIGVEYCFFIGSSRTLNRILFQNYKQDIPEILFNSTSLSSYEFNNPNLYLKFFNRSSAELKFTKFV